MKRKIYSKLIEWKNKKTHKPLIVIGARQVGKTYTIEEFCKNEFKNFVTFNLFENNEIIELFKNNWNSEDKYIALKSIIGPKIDIEDNNTIIFFDEIQESEELISSLKFFNEKHPNVNIICAGSLLGVKLKRSKFSFPVGKVEMLNMFPLDFEEFLINLDKDFLVKNIKECFETFKPLNEPFNNMALKYFRYFLCVGGMPESVLNLIENNEDISKYNLKILQNIVEAYFEDMTKYVKSDNETLKIKKIYESIPSQLSNETKKFQFSKIEKNARKRNYETPLDWLMASNLIMKSSKVKTPEIPPRAFIDNDSFKLFLSDVGILRDLVKLNIGDILIDNLSLYKGAIIENYVANQLMSNDLDLLYWTAEGKAKIDFLIYNNDGIIPIEVKAGENTKSKSLNFYISKFNPKYSIRVSTKNFGFENNIKSIPLYAMFCITNEINNF